MDTETVDQVNWRKIKMKNNNSNMLFEEVNGRMENSNECVLVNGNSEHIKELNYSMENLSECTVYNHEQ